MALFKVSRGTSQNLPTELTEGYCWYTYDDSKFYIDFKNENGVLTRQAINAANAETLTGYTLDQILEAAQASASEQDVVILTEAQSYTDTALNTAKSYTETVASTKADAEHTHDTSDLRGAISIDNGGTGATTAEDAKTNLGIPTIHSGTTVPNNSLGKDGDIYIMYSNQ